MWCDSFAERAWVGLLLQGTLDTDISFGHCDPTTKIVQVMIKNMFFQISKGFISFFLTLKISR